MGIILYSPRRGRKQRNRRLSRHSPRTGEDIESSETEDYEFVPRNDHGPGGDHAVRKNRYLSPEKFDVTIVDRPEDRQTEDYLAIPREDEEDEENSETEDYLAIPRGQEEDIESSEIEDYEFVPRNDHGPGGDHAVRKTRYLRR